MFKPTLSISEKLITELNQDILKLLEKYNKMCAQAYLISVHESEVK